MCDLSMVGPASCVGYSYYVWIESHELQQMVMFKQKLVSHQIIR